LLLHHIFIVPAAIVLENSSRYAGERWVSPCLIARSQLRSQREQLSRDRSWK
jgi:hypothetical protein